MKVIKVTLLLGLVVVTMTGCGQQVVSDKNISKTEVSKVSVEESSTELDQANQEKPELADSVVPVIGEGELLEKIATTKKTVFLVGDSTSKEYQVALVEASAICSALSLELYQTDIANDKGKELEAKYQASFGSKLSKPYDLVACNQEGKFTPLEPFDERMPAEIRKNLFKAMVLGEKIVD